MEGSEKYLKASLGVIGALYYRYDFLSYQLSTLLLKLYTYYRITQLIFLLDLNLFQDRENRSDVEHLYMLHLEQSAWYTVSTQQMLYLPPLPNEPLLQWWNAATVFIATSVLRVDEIPWMVFTQEGVAKSSCMLPHSDILQVIWLLVQLSIGIPTGVLSICDGLPHSMVTGFQ